MYNRIVKTEFVKRLMIVFVTALIVGLVLVVAMANIPFLNGKIGDGALILLMLSTMAGFFVVAVREISLDRFPLRVLAGVLLAAVLTAVWLYVGFVLVLIVFRPSGPL